MDLRRFLTRNILLLGLISLFTDIASEMLYPITPLYLRQIGYGLVAVGLMEGVSELIAGLSKTLFGYVSDKLQKRKLFIQIGYGLSATVKPVIGITKNSGIIFISRIFDRLGKGIRTAPRDALLALESAPEMRGRVFGFHRSMDTLGATLGPLVAICVLYFFPQNYRLIFLLTLIPGALALLLTFAIQKEPTTTTKTATQKRLLWSDIPLFWNQSSRFYRRLLYGFFIVAILNSSDMFLLIRAREVGYSDITILWAYVVFNITSTLASYPAGYLSDRIGFNRVFVFSLLLFCVTYGLFGNTSILSSWLFVIFPIYGVFSAIYNGAAKGWLSKYLKNEEQGTGMGLYQTISSVGFLIGSLLIALIWQQFGAIWAFSITALGGVLLTLYFINLQEESSIPA